MTLMTAVSMGSCESDGKNKTDGDDSVPIAISDNKGQVRTVYAYTEKLEVGITSRTAWTASIADTTANSGSVEWLRLFVNDVETYEGEAGAFTLEVRMDVNTTGLDRTAAVTIANGNDDDEVMFAVIQKGITEGEEPTEDSLIATYSRRHIRASIDYPYLAQVYQLVP
jgi:hypothetical protein